MNVNLNTNINTNRVHFAPSKKNNNTDTNTINQNSAQITPNQAKAIAAQRISFKQSLNNRITEDDVNIAVTCKGWQNIRSNKREVQDYRANMSSAKGYNWSKNFNQPCIIRNGNLDEKIKGNSTAIVFPLKPGTDGARGGDNAVILLNGDIPDKTLFELVVYLDKIGVLDKTPLYNKRYYINSTNPAIFMENPKIKTAIANFLNQYEVKETAHTDKVNNDNKDTQINTTDINIVNINRNMDKNNTRFVKDYLRDFLMNDKKMTVVYDKFTSDCKEKDMTAILIPSTKSEWDCITVTIDRKIPQQKCKDLINYLVKNNMANINNENFRKFIAEYLNNN